MKLPVPVRIYNMSDGELKQTADGLSQNIKRDLAVFATRNVDRARLEQLDNLTAAFDATTTDEEIRGYVSVAVAERDVKGEAVRMGIRDIRNMAQLVYKGVGKYVVFKFEDMSTLTDSDLCRMSKRVLRVATQLKADLAPEGLTDALLTDFGNRCDAFDAAIDMVAGEQARRDLETQDRILKGNALYTMVMELASVGKTLFESKDEARFNDYVLIGGESVVKDDTPPAPDADIPPAGDPPPAKN